MQPIRFGFFYDFRNPPQWQRPWADFYAETLRFIAWTESIGFDGAWMAEHHGAEDGYMPSPLVIAAALAARTSRMRIGTALAVAPLYHPVRFAEDCAVTDILSNGRLEIGLGVGWRRAETDAWGVRFETRGAYTDEFIQVVRRLWRGEEVTFRGRHITVDRALVTPRPVQEDIPLLVGGFSPPALRRAAQLGDGYLGFSECRAGYVDALRAAGKAPEAGRFALMHLAFYVSRDPEKTLREIGPHVLYTNNAYGKWQIDAKHDYAAEGSSYFRPFTMQELIDSGKLLVLTPADAIAWLRKEHAFAPFDTFLTLAPPSGYPFERFAEHVELFANEVLPAFR